MPFSGDDFQLLRLPPYAGPLTRQLLNIADGLTTLKGDGGGDFTLDAAAIIGAIPGNPGDNQVIKYDLATLVSGGPMMR